MLSDFVLADYGKKSQIPYGEFGVNLWQIRHFGQLFDLAYIVRESGRGRLYLFLLATESLTGVEQLSYLAPRNSNFLLMTRE